eukprot:CAMPEP_0179206786 /NCGR_PEP_ID=MMETSP0796-20121207/103110_1 /TAXON_ID=73915 /ORGANISM="Pyrodinium bahamense, Strain pbaha01" /LENGTH=297 /DNA_ID=CAMNT_0020911709 /DNA_START=1 /DNA_END=895 /DNA_ORIENTATION=+
MAMQYSEIINTAFSAFQSVYGVVSHQDDLTWSEIDFTGQVRQIRQDILNNTREEMYDTYEKKERTLETNLVVATLMLGIGFGFAVEGTFPDDVKSQWVARYFYTASAAFGLVFPFLSVVAIRECRRRLNHFMMCFNKAFSVQRNEESDSARARIMDVGHISDYAHHRTHGLPGSRGSAELRTQLQTQALPVPPATAESPGGPPPQHAVVFARWAADHVEPLAWKAEVLLRIGVGSDLLTCALLLGMYLQSHFPDTPHLWMVYSGIVACGLLSWIFAHSQVFGTPPDPEFNEPFLITD